MNSASVSTVAPSISNTASSFSNNNILVVILVVLLVLSVFNINIFHVMGDIVEKLREVFGPLIMALGFTTGTVINATSDVVSDTAKAGIDVADNGLNMIGDGLISATDGKVGTHRGSLDNILNGNRHRSGGPDPTPGESSIQKPISSGKTSWCLVGEYQGTRGCVDVNEGDKCISGKLFPSQKMCLNPTLSQNA